MTISNFRYIFSDYDLPLLPPLKRWREYSFHIQESSLRTVLLAERKINEFLSGRTLSPQTWVDLKLYGLSNARFSINTLGRNFISYCSTAPTEFAKEVWLYRSHKNSLDNEVRFRFYKRVQNLHILLSHVPERYQKKIVDNSPESNRILAFSEHLIQYPLALNRLFELSWSDIVQLTFKTDTQWQTLISHLSTSEQTLAPLLKRITSYNREFDRRLFFIAALMIIPTIDRVELNGYASLTINYPYSNFFSNTDFIIYLNKLDSYQLY